MHEGKLQSQKCLKVENFKVQAKLGNSFLNAGCIGATNSAFDI